MLHDPGAKAFVAVFPADKESLAREAIEKRKKVSLLEKLPRPIILAFCVKTDGDAPVYISTSPPFRYQLGAAPGPNYVLVEETYRLPGVYVENPRSLAYGDAVRLAEQITAWASHHSVDLEQLRVDEALRTPHSEILPSSHLKKVENALERLYAAQPQGFAERIVIPFDIAVYLSRLP